MAYTKQTWANGAGGATPLSAARLTHIEDGIGDVDTALAAKADTAAVSDRYAPRRAQTILFFGDSLEEKGGSIAGNLNRTYAASWPWAMDLLGQPFDIIANLGVGGQTSAQILARVPDVIAASPGIVHGGAGTNDVGNAVNPSVTTANLTAIWNALGAAGIVVVWRTLPPRTGATTTQKASQATINNFIRRAGATRKSFIVADVEAALTDQSTTNYVAGYSGDGVHNDTPTGGYAGGVAVANALRPLVVMARDLPASKADPVNLLGASGRFFLGIGLPADGWQQAQYAVLPTSSAVARTDGVNGNWRQLAIPNGDKVVLTVNIPIQANANGLGTPLSVGDIVEMLVEYECSSLDAAPVANTTFMTAKIQPEVGGTFIGPNMRYDLWSVGGVPNMPTAARTGVFRTGPLTIPATTTLVQASIEVRGGGSYRFDRVVVRKMIPGLLPG